VYVNIRSKLNPKIRVQKRIKELKTKSAALHEEKKTSSVKPLRRIIPA
jgi:hypothetical protein